MGSRDEDTDKADILVEPQTPAKQTLIDAFIILTVCLVTFFLGLGGLALVGPDEPRYAEVAREMFASGDYISTRLCGCLWFEKPALLYWLAAVCYRLLGVSEFAARMPSALAALGTGWAIYFGTRSLISRKSALIAALVFATAGLAIAYGRVSTPDMLLTLSMTVGLVAAYRATEADSHRAAEANRVAAMILWILFAIAVGVAALAKGLVGVILCPLILIVYLALVRRRSWPLWPALLAMILAFAAVAGVWYGPVIARHDGEFFREFFIRHHFSRYTSDAFHHPQPFYFFFVVAVLGLVPWSLFLIPAVLRIRHLRPRAHGSDRLLVFAWVWVLVVLFFFSASGSKLPGYILPVVPALSLITGHEIAAYLTAEPSISTRVAAWGVTLTILALGLAPPVLASHWGFALAGAQRFLAYGPAVLAATLLILLIARKRMAWLIGAVAAVCATVAASVLVLSTPINERISLKPLSLEVAEQLRPNEKICFFIKKEFAPVFYAQGRVVCRYGEMDILNALREDILEDALKRAREEGSPSLIVITTANWRRGLEGYPAFDTELVTEQGEALAFRVRLRER